MSVWFLIVLPLFTCFSILLLLCFLYYRRKKTKSLELNLLRKPSPPVILDQGLNEREQEEKTLKRISERIRSSSFIQMLEQRDSLESRPKTSEMNGSKNPNFDFLVLPRSSPSPNGHSSSSSISSSTLSLVDSTTDSVNRLILDDKKMKDCRPSEIEFTLNYFSSTSTLHATLIRANYLPTKYLSKNYESFIKVSFKSMSKMSKTKRYKTKGIANTDPTLFFDEAVPFNDCPFNDLKNHRLRIALYVKMIKSSITSTLTSSGKCLIGDIYVPLSRPDLEPDTLIGIKEKLSSACQLTGKRGPLLMSGNLGFLKISLEYLTENQRVKIMIRRGQHFPPAINSTFALLGSPEHFVIVSLMKNQDTIVYKETKSVLGINPSFNQVFLFYLDQLDIDSSGNIKKSSFDEYWIQILVMRGKFHTKDGLVGHILIGNDTSLVGSQHWNQVLSSPSVEVTKWHAVTDLT